ncbi:FAD-dependent oxidoreductase [Pseudomaricurvus alkylphenolicus]|uniref:FAD/NAD(P)-dependent oxidoreductase n=1 Tax=Pseudomaricurvus alkylphenolicus TaxID=1306991 RepID=UPI00141FFAFD|nr:NAD(P)/FAD-dependent oxidoreductase [Pseudomaricurvus alkylphenolicus]NIB40299.1 FAD-dependent oxidoreductase [Pseudomaricurvus alkylphenolicus]
MDAELVIVGAGPAGLAAAEIASVHGLNVIVLDEQTKPGGQIFRQPPEGFRVHSWMPDSIYREGKSVLASASTRKNIRWLLGSTVLGTFAAGSNGENSNRIKVVVDTGVLIEEIQTEHLIFATGCHDMAAAFPGWNLPGVMATGGIQAFVKSQQIVPGERFLFVGTHPLQLIVADQVCQAGGHVVGVVFAQQFKRMLSIIRNPFTMLRFSGKFLFLAKTLYRLRNAGVPVSFQESLVRANGDLQVSSIDIASISLDGIVQKNESRRVEADRLGVCYNFLVSSELARQSGAECEWSSQAGGWIVRHNQWMQSSVPGISVAGEVTGVAGADAALEEGRLAALGVLLKKGVLGSTAAARLAEPVRRRLSNINAFAGLLRELSYPGNLLNQLLSDETNICKCEGITAGDIKKALAENSCISSGSAVKLISRTGMGLCQGRYCNYPLTKAIAEYREASENEVGPFTAQFPVKPVLIKKITHKPDEPA